MNKTTFLDALRAALKALPKKERQQYLDYYAEMIDDRMEDGISEEEAVAALGSPGAIAAQILAETPHKPARKIRVWEIILLVLGSPIWLTVGLALVIVLVSVVLVLAAVYILLWSAIVVLYAADLTLLIGCLAGIAGGAYYLIAGAAAPAVLFFGAGLACGGCVAPLFFACNLLARWLARLGKWAVLRTIALLRRKGNEK